MKHGERLRALDARLVAAAKNIRVLSLLTWPEETVQEFLRTVERQRVTIPAVTPPPVRLDDEIEALSRIIDDADPDEPMERYVRDTARSYRDAAEMLAHVGTPGFVERSREIYGSPRDRVYGSDETHRDIADSLLANTDSLASAGIEPESDFCVPAARVQRELEAAFRVHFGEESPEVVLDKSLASKAAAGVTRIRVRDQTCFSERDIAQLIEHEGFVHSGTALNGRAQPYLTSMSLGAPRTTLTQEGLATLAELTTRSMDIARLRRLALRTVAIDHALDGADYVEVYRFFLEGGQSETESAHSAMRVFRGGDLRGRVAFTKDVVYLGGLVGVHTFFRKAIAESRPHLVRRLFAGRMALGDVFSLDRAFADGHVGEPRYVPRWATDIQQLAAYLAFSAVMNQVDLREVELESILA